MTRRIVTSGTVAASLLLPGLAHAAQPPSDGAQGEAGLSADGDGAQTEGGTRRSKRAKDRGDQPWIRRWAPERNMGEIGIFGGILLPARRLELFEPDLDLPDQGFKEFSTVAPDVGLRFGYYPSRFLGLEAEGAVMPTETDPGGDQTILYAGRGHLVGQIGLWSITPFVLAGATALGVASDREAVGNDVDLAFHFGGGVKFHLNRWVNLRLDVRDTLSAGRGVGDGVINNVEVLGGITLTLGRKRAPKPAGPIDTDGDGIFDPDDRCVDTPGVPEYQGCPVPDTDGDGIVDPDDKCVDTPGVPEFEGCPVPDTDGDGILDPDDKCVDTPGVPEYEGCPIPDTDGDGFLDPDDECVNEPETQNGFKDGDGCPDEVPKELEKFTGVIEGIFFDTNRDSIKKKSETRLQNAADILAKFPTIRIEVSGHTDSKGNDEYNAELSRRRAESVKQWLVDHGIDGARIQTRGAGENEPIASNSNKAGRAQNRRIEFRLLDQ